MSLTKNKLTLLTKIVEDLLRRRTYRRFGVQMNKRQSYIYGDALCILVLGWYDLTSKSDETPRWLKPFCCYLQEEDVTTIVSLLKAADLFLIESRSQFFNYDTFKQYLMTVSPSAGRFIAPLKDLIASWSLYRDIDSFSSLHNAFVLITRLSLPDLKDLQEIAMQEFVECDDSLIGKDYTNKEAEIISSWFPILSTGYLYDNWHPKHGPGTVADIQGSIIWNKYEAMGSDDMIRRMDFLLGGMTQPRTNVLIDRCAKVEFVPKSVDKLRTICKEPTSLMWYQQGFAHSIMMYIKNHHYLRRRIHLEDQEQSRELAYQGSIDGKLSTIDLRSASDMVSWSLVKKWFQHSSLLPIFWMTRSRECVLPGGGRRALNKFAPMGSSLNFPAECIVFCAIVEAAIMKCNGRPHNSVYCVYGDDIIIETQYALAVIRELELNGFRVNTLKSFYLVEKLNFRESCGGEYLAGQDVSPVRLSRRFGGLDLNGRTPSFNAAVIDLANACYMRLPSVRRYLIWQLLKLPKHLQPPFSGTGEIGLFSPNPSNFHLEAPKYRKHIQDFWISHGGIQPVGEKPLVEQDLLLYEQLRGTNLRNKLSTPEDLFLAASDVVGKIKWGVMTSPVRELESQTSMPTKRGFTKT